MMSKPKYIVILTGLFFCSTVAGGTSHIYSFFPKNFASVDFLYDNIGLWLGKPIPGQNDFERMHIYPSCANIYVCKIKKKCFVQTISFREFKDYRAKYYNYYLLLIIFHCYYDYHYACPNLLLI